MAREKFQQFHDDLRAAVDAGVPLEIGSSRGGPDRLTVSRLESLHTKFIAAFDESGKPDVSELSVAVESLPIRFRAAFQFFSHTGIMSPVLAGLSVRPIARAQAEQAIAWMWRYLALIVVAAFAGFYLFSSTVAPLIAELRADMENKRLQVAQPIEDFLPPWFNLLPLLGILLLVLLVWGALGQVKRWSYWLGGKTYIQVRLQNSMVRTIPLLMSVDLPKDEAVRISRELVGLEDESEIDRILNEDSPWLAKSDQLSCLANRVLLKLKFRTPIVMVAILGGIIGLVYCALIFYPISSLLQEIGRPPI